MGGRTVRIPWSGGIVTGRWRRPRKPAGRAVLLAHGAGTHQDHPAIVELAAGISRHGHPVLTFNYPYTEAGRRAPDRRPVLLDCHRAAAAWLRSHIDLGIVLAGRSMGGRMATHLAAEGEPMDGLVLYAYPLHPPGKPDRLRVDHLASIPVPMLFFAGTRDPLSRLDLFDTWVRPLPNVTDTVIEDADHSFRVPKRSGRTHAQVVEELVDVTVAWIRALSPPR